MAESILKPGLDLSISASQTSSSRNTRLEGSRLWTARGLWVAIVFLFVGVMAAALPTYAAAIRHIAPDSTPIASQLTRGDANGLIAAGISLDTYIAALLTIKIIYISIHLLVACFLVLRRSSDWLAMLTAAMLISLGTTTNNVNLDAVTALVEAHAELAALRTLSFYLGGFIGICFFFSFPDGRFVPRWGIVPVTAWGVWSLAIFLNPDLNLNLVTMPVASALPIEGVFGAAVIYAQIDRYRRFATPIQRQQSKWFVYGFSMSFVGAVAFPILANVFLPIVNEPGAARALYHIVFAAAIALGGLMIPLSITFAVLRQRLWEIDLVINRSIVYGIVTVLLALLFLICLTLLQSLFMVITRDSQSNIAFIASALAVGALFNPARRRLQNFVDLHLYGLRFDLNQLREKAAVGGIAGALSGEQLGPYQILEPLGRGGMSEVYKARQITLNRVVALKILSEAHAKDQEFRIRFEREAQTVANLRHPNIVNVFDFGAADNLFYMVMDYIEGQTLADWLLASGALPLAEARPIICDIAHALDYAHEQGLVHRDVKPSNIMLQPVTSPSSAQRQRAVLMDFGIAKILDRTTNITKTGMVGTLDYVAPEQIMSAREVDKRADIYSLGIVAYEMLTGQLPFGDDSVGNVLFGHLQRPAPDPRLLVPSLPDEAAWAVLRALDKRPERRFQSATSFAYALEDR